MFWSKIVFRWIQMWLLPTLKLSQFKTLFSASGIALRSLNEFMSYSLLHSYCNKLTPKSHSIYSTAISLYDLHHTHLPLREWQNLQLVTRHNVRTNSIFFFTNSNNRTGYNRLSNRFQCLNNLVRISDLSLSKPQFKKHLKHHLLQ